jgi:hypothetical protein
LEPLAWLSHELLRKSNDRRKGASISVLSKEGERRLRPGLKTANGGLRSVPSKRDPSETDSRAVSDSRELQVIAPGKTSSDRLGAYRFATAVLAALTAAPAEFAADMPRAGAGVHEGARRSGPDFMSARPRDMDGPAMTSIRQ